MSKEGIKKVAQIFSDMQETRIDLLKNGLEQEKVDQQDLYLASLLLRMNDFAKDDFSTLTLMS
jgi:hypothetical protein